MMNNLSFLHMEEMGFILRKTALCVTFKEE